MEPFRCHKTFVVQRTVEVDGLSMSRRCRTLGLYVLLPTRDLSQEARWRHLGSKLPKLYKSRFPLTWKEHLGAQQMSDGILYDFC